MKENEHFVSHLHYKHSVEYTEPYTRTLSLFNSAFYEVMS